MSRLTREEMHAFIGEFVSRYYGRLSEGRDMRELFDFELTCKEDGFRPFYLDMTYTNSAGKSMTVKDRRDDFLIVEYDGELCEADYWYDEDVEWLVVEGERWSSTDTTEQ